MVAISFSMPGLIYKILTKSKVTTIREFNKKWERIYNNFRNNPDKKIPLTFFHTQRSKYGFKFLDSYIEDLEIYDLKEMTDKDAKMDGGANKEELLLFFQKNYGSEFLDKRFVRIWWDKGFNNKTVRPNNTRIDWFDKEEQRLFTINPFVIHKKENINCLYQCVYCYAKPFYVRRPEQFISGFYEGRLKGLKYAKENVFISSTTDLFHYKIPNDFIRYILEKANEYNVNNCNLYYLTKNPKKYQEVMPYFNPETNWIGATIETDTYEFQEYDKITIAPEPKKRIDFFKKLKYERSFLSLEPLLKFSEHFIDKIIDINPSFVIIGTNTNNTVKNRLIEPSGEDVAYLIESLTHKGIKVIKKKNLDRLFSENIINKRFSQKSLIQKSILDFGKETLN